MEEGKFENRRFQKSRNLRNDYQRVPSTHGNDIENVGANLFATWNILFTRIANKFAPTIKSAMGNARPIHQSFILNLSS